MPPKQLYDDIESAIRQTSGPFVIDDIAALLPGHVDWTIIREVIWYWIDQGLVDLTQDRKFERLEPAEQGG